MRRVTTEGGGDVDAVSAVKQIQQTVSDYGQNVRRGAGPDTALIFAKRDVAYVKNCILDSPVPADHAQQSSRIGLIAS
jgi:hypothetical protein